MPAKLLVVGVLKRPASTPLKRWILRIYAPGGGGLSAWLECSPREAFRVMRQWWEERTRYAYPSRVGCIWWVRHG